MTRIIEERPTPCRPLAPLREALSPATRCVRLEAPLPLRHGGHLDPVHLAYERWGPETAPTVVILPGLSPSAHAAASPEDPSPGWWEYVVGPRRPLDTERLQVLCFNHLGSCFGSTGPASIDPARGEPYGPRFPALAIEDLAEAVHRALRQLGHAPVHLVGTSMGGMVALALAALHPDDVAGLTLISSAPRATATAIAIRSLQREMVTADPAWREGRYYPGPGPLEGMRLARKLGFISYRSGAEWDQRFGREPYHGAQLHPFAAGFQVESYLEANARKFAQRFDANSFLQLSRAMDRFDIDAHGGLAAVGRRLPPGHHLVVGVETDFLFPIQQQIEIAEGLRAGGQRVRLARLPSLQGHDAFLVDKARFAPLLAEHFHHLA